MRLIALAWLGLTLVLAEARADEPPATPPPTPPPVEPTPPPVEPTPPAVPHGRIKGKIFERGTITSLPAATVVSGSGETVVADEKGAFVLELPVGPVQIAVTADGYETLKVTEKIEANVEVQVEYRLLPLPSYRSRYQTTVRGAARHEGQRVTFREEELRQMPGSLGEPFRVIGTLPGVAQPVPLLPAFVVRGASPGMNGFFLDGMRVPQLFHLLIGGGVVHPRLIDHLEFYPGAYDSSFGRYAGGIIDASTRPARDGYHAELELRLYDVSALVEARLPGDLRVIASGHYGYPGPIIHLLEPRVDVDYWDYQLRADWRGLMLEALGSYDSLHFQRGLFTGDPANKTKDEFRLTFHRVQLRYQARKGRFFFEAAIVGGYDELNALGGQGVRRFGLGARVNARFSTRPLDIQVGLDSELSRFTAQNFAMEGSVAMPDQFRDLAGNRDGIVASTYALGTLALGTLLKTRPINITAGVRLDTYHAGKVTLVGVDPRVQFRAEPTDWLEIHGGVGLYQQPPSFPVALPGVDTFALQLGLQRSIQGAVGLKTKLPQGISFDVTGYYQKFNNINDVVLDISAIACTSPPPESLSGAVASITHQLDGQAWGAEMMLRKTGGRFSGWISYTVGRAERIYSCGLRPSDFDQTHIFNFVFQVRLPWKLMLGHRLYIATGRPFTQLPTDGGFDMPPPRNNARFPTYVQFDLRIDREWIFKRWALSIFLECLNLTYSMSVFGVTYPIQKVIIGGVEQMIPRYDQPQLTGFQWILPSIGIRGRF